MKCVDRDSDLLLLAHGQLNIMRQVGTNVHLLKCRRCQTRFGEFGALSQVLAQTITSADNPSGRALPVPLTPRKFMTGLVAVAVIVACVMFLAIRFGTPEPQYSLPVNHLPSPAIGCRPGLPSDKCK